MDSVQYDFIIILLGLIAAALIINLFKRKTNFVLSVDDSFDTKLERINKAAAHHLEVNAVMALTEQFKRDPDLAKNLAGYSDEVVYAALTYRVNSLGNDLKYVDGRLSYARKDLADHPSSANNAYYTGNVASLEKLRANLQAQLNEAATLINERATTV